MTAQAQEDREIVRLHRKRKMTKRVVIGGIVAVCLLIFCFVVFKPVYHEWQARSLAKRAKQILDQGKFDASVLEMANRAYQCAPNDPNVVRLLATLYSRQRGGAVFSVQYWRKLMERGKATSEDKVALARQLVAIFDFPSAQAVLVQVTGEARNSLDYREAEAAVLQHQGHPAESENILRAAWQSSPNDPYSRLKLAEADSQSLFEEIRSQAQDTMWEIARGESASSEAALKDILALTDLSESMGSEILGLLEKNANIARSQKLEILALCIRRFPSMREKIVGAEVARASGKPVEEVVDHYQWLSRIGEPLRVLNELSGPAKAKSSPVEKADGFSGPVPKEVVFRTRGLFTPYVDALITTKQWPALEHLLQAKDVPLTLTDKELMRAICANGFGHPETEVEMHLEAAFAAARQANDEEGAFRTTLTGDLLGHSKFALLSAQSVHYTDRKLNAANLVRIYQIQAQQHDLAGMIATAETAIRERGESEPFSDDSRYLKILGGVEAEPVLDEFHSMTEEEKSKNQLRRLTSILAHYRCGEIAEAKSEAIKLDPSGLPPGPRGVLAGILAEVGERALATSIAAKIPSGTLFQEEQWFLELAKQ